MPPVAKEFHLVLELLVEEQAGGITSWRALSKRLAELDPERQTMENWKSSINRYRRREITPREKTIKLFARAFGVERDVFPPVPRRQTLAEVQEELATVRGRLAALEAVVGNLELERREEAREASPRARQPAS